MHAVIYHASPLRTMTNVNQAPLPRLSKAPLVRASLVKRRYIKYLALSFSEVRRVDDEHSGPNTEPCRTEDKSNRCERY